MIRVLFIVSMLRRSGPTNVLFNLIAKLDQNKIEPIILTLSKENKVYYNLKDDFLNIGVKVYSLDLSRINGFLIGKIKVKKIVKELNIDCIHVSSFRGDFIVKKVDYPNIKIISTINSNIYEDYTMHYGTVKGKMMAYLHILCLKNKVIVSCSNSVAKQLYFKYGIDLHVIQNGVDKDIYFRLDDEKKMVLRKELHLPIRKKIFIFIGVLITRKDPITAIKGFLNSKIKDNCFLVVIGDGFLKEQCQELCLNNENVLFLGNIPETLNYLRAADFYLSTALSEGLPTSVMEALSCGLPVLLSDIDPHQELLGSIYDWKFYFETHKSESLANKIDAIVNEEYEFLSRQCRSVIDLHINSEIMAKKYQELYIA